MIMLLMMSYSLLCRYTNDPPPDAHAVFELLPPQGDAQPIWCGRRERCLRLLCLINPTRCTRRSDSSTPFRYHPSYDPSPMSLKPSSSLILPPPQPLCSFLLSFPSTLLPLPPPSKRLFALHSACLPSTHARTPGAPVTQRGFHLKELLRTSL